MLLYAAVIGKQLDIVGARQFPEFDQLTVETLDLPTIKKAEEFLTALRRFYNNKFTRAKADESKITSRLKEQLENPDDLTKLRNHYHNETIEEMVKNKGIDRIVEEDNRFIQKMYPVFMTPDTDGIFNFRTQFLVAFKPFFGVAIPTYAFNVLVMWVMTTVLFILLFYDVLGRLILRK